jgi:Superfamily II DNA helicase
MTQPNEQLIETIRDVVTAVDRTGYTIATWHSNDEIAGWLRALLEENKHLKEQRDGYYENAKFTEAAAAKDKVLQWYAEEDEFHCGNCDQFHRDPDYGDQARTILSSYPPREKGAGKSSCNICSGYGGYVEGEGPLAETIPCPKCNEVKP